MAENATPSHPQVQQPAYQKLSLIMLGLVAFVYALGQAQSILLPLLFAMLLAMLLNPLVNRMTRMRWPRILAIFLAVLLAMACAAGLAYFLLTQAANFSETLPELREKVAALGITIRDWLENETPIAPGAVNDALAEAKEKGMQTGGKLVGGALLTMGTLFAFVFLLPVFTFLILLYKRLLLNFIVKLFPDEHRAVVQDVLQGSKGVTQHYLMGLMLQAVIMATLTYVGLLIIGVEYALLLSVIAAVLNLIPYVGMLMATLLAVVIALATRRRHHRLVGDGPVRRGAVHRQQHRGTQRGGLARGDQCPGIHHRGDDRRSHLGHPWHVPRHPAHRHRQGDVRSGALMEPFGLRAGQQRWLREGGLFQDKGKKGKD